MKRGPMSYDDQVWALMEADVFRHRDTVQVVAYVC